MRISIAWLSEYVALPPAAELQQRLTMAGLEVEAVERLGQGLELVVAGRILESKPHPSADKLSVTRVDAGGGALQIVCGAKNYKVGDVVPVARVGAKLPGGLEIKKANLRGVESEGMLCSTTELGLEDDKSGGLMILDPATEVGAPISKVLGLDDTLFEVNVTPNRPDALSHLGVAREVAALTGAPLRAPSGRLQVDAGLAGPEVRVVAADRCPRYAARIVDGVTVKPSPRWMQARLAAAGVRPINNVVDATNYVLLELGQPLHAFDLDHLAGRQVEVRLARPKEPLKTLDGKDRVLDAQDLVIADAERAVALAGVMGGSSSEVRAETRRILLESACFEPTGTRRTARAHGLHTEASHRFERGVDVEGAAVALDRAAGLIAELAGGRVSKVVDHRPGPRAKVVVKLDPGRVSALLGSEVPREDSARILTALGFQVEGAASEGFTVTVPSYRVDVTCEEDLIEEVARIRGYDSIAGRPPRVTSTDPSEDPRHAVEGRIRQAMAAGGLDEVVNYSFVSAEELAGLDPKHSLGAPIALKNPISADMAVMRTSLLPGLLRNLKLTLRHQGDTVRLYELGRVYRPSEGQGESPAREEERLAGVVYGRRSPLSWAAGKDKVDVYDAKGAVEDLMDSLRARATFVPDKEIAWLHPLATARILVGSETLGWVGEVHPLVSRRLDLPPGVFAFDLSMEALSGSAALVPAYRGIPRFPGVLRDLAVVVDTRITARALEEAIRSAGGPLVESVTLFDVYQGDPLPEGKKNVAFAIRYLSPDRTLTDAEAVETHDRIVAALTRDVGAQLRA